SVPNPVLPSFPTRRSSDLLSILHQLLVAGNETTTTLLAESMRLLVADPAEYAKVAADTDGSYTATVVEEGLRLCSPAQGMFRVVDRKSTRLNSSHLVISYA